MGTVTIRIYKKTRDYLKVRAAKERMTMQDLVERVSKKKHGKRALP